MFRQFTILWPSVLSTILFLTSVIAPVLGQPPEDAYAQYREPWRSFFEAEQEQLVADARAKILQAETNIKVALQDVTLAEAALKRAFQKGTATHVKIAQAALQEARSGAKSAPARAERAREYLGRIIANDPPYFGAGDTMGPIARWKTDDLGRSTQTIRISQVVDKRRLLVTDDDRDVTIMLTIGSTADLVDGRRVSLDSLYVRVTGTTSYITVLGAKRTVLAAEAMPMAALKK